MNNSFLSPTASLRFRDCLCCSDRSRRGTTKTPAGREMRVIFLEHASQSQKRSSGGIPWMVVFSCVADPIATWKTIPSCKYRNVAEQAGFAHFDTIVASTIACQEYSPWTMQLAHVPGHELTIRVWK